ncbi:hypothetical protein JWZ98_02630 [Methylomonas sp. EFPC1]|uniref:hypothetical protein n=1 Tax=Methylomonas sp. EFPC1 TaxID=2812647 RepID=UPI001967193C|nr:hypothetical protein [Methylomonas sp. EFPC1]QSB01873.1 hypothetical protein JWZ98_02630 [Methylomonas sp. EFPC1]
MTNGSFQVSEFNGSFPAINLKSGQSPGDPNLTVALLQTSQSAKSSAWELEIYKAVIGDRIQRPILRHPHIEGACQYRALAISANTE